MLSREVAKTNLIVFGLTRLELEPMIYKLEVSMLTIPQMMQIKLITNNIYMQKIFWGGGNFYFKQEFL